MKTVSISVGTIPAFYLVEGDPNYYTELLSYTLLKHLESLETEGFTVTQVETSDVQAVEAVVNTWEADFTTWLDAAYTAGISELPVPAPPALPDLSNTTDSLQGWVVNALIQLSIKLVTRWIQRKFEGGKDYSEIAQVLSKGLLGETGGEVYSLLELLAQSDLRIIIDRNLEFQDISYDTST